MRKIYVRGKNIQAAADTEMFEKGKVLSTKPYQHQYDKDNANKDSVIS